MDTDEESRQREISFIEFELHEIASADLKRGEDEELESRFRKMSNSQRIISDLSTAVQLLSEGSDNVMDMMGILSNRLLRHHHLMSHLNQLRIRVLVLKI